MSHGYGATDDAQSIATLQHALDLGVTFLDTADFYGAGHNEELIGRGRRRAPRRGGAGHEVRLRQPSGRTHQGPR
ncbi:aldo/keto reductase [Nonomuraea dietziae]|uniref:aldo/keto reductase n=1 Tax=Nonomuraea dietziae TaxID=65515 RepID=UPI0031CFD28C